MAKIITLGVTGCHDDPPLTANIESRLRKLIWDNDIAIGGSYIVSFDIHAIDAALWVVGQRPIAAMGYWRISGLTRTAAVPIRLPSPTSMPTA